MGFSLYLGDIAQRYMLIPLQYWVYMDFPIPYFSLYISLFSHSSACCNKGFFFHDKPPLTSVRSSDFKVHATKQKRGLFFLEGLLPVITWKPGISAGPKVHLKRS